MSGLLPHAHTPGSPISFQAKSLHPGWHRLLKYWVCRPCQGQGEATGSKSIEELWMKTRQILSLFSGLMCISDVTQNLIFFEHWPLESSWFTTDWNCLGNLWLRTGYSKIIPSPTQIDPAKLSVSGSTCLLGRLYTRDILWTKDMDVSEYGIPLNPLVNLHFLIKMIVYWGVQDHIFRQTHIAWLWSETHLFRL